VSPSAPTVEESTAGHGVVDKTGHRTKKGSGVGLRPDWAKLPGHTVEVWLRGEHVATGVVDQAAEDDSVLWLAGAGADTRRLFDKGTGYQVWV